MGENTKKVQEIRFKWYGHVMRREEHYVGRRTMVMKVQGRRKRGRPKKRWLDKVGETGASCNKINKFMYCTSVDCPFETFMVPILRVVSNAYILIILICFGCHILVESNVT